MTGPPADNDRARCDNPSSMRFFNTEGPVRPDDHYHIPPLNRVNLDELLGLVRDKRYFVLHAPRQTGKTSALLALRDLLNAGGDHRCVYINVEPAQAARENVAEAMRVTLYQLASEEQATLGSRILTAIWRDALEGAGPLGALRASLERWCMAEPKPLVLLIDEIDTLVGDNPAVGAAPAPRRLSEPPGPLPTERAPVRRARRARLPHPLHRAERPGARRQRLQTSSPTRCVWATSPRPRPWPCSRSTQRRPGRCSPRRRWN